MISLFAIGIFAALGPWIHPSVAFIAPLRVAILFLAFLGVLTLASGWPGSDRVGGGSAGVWTRMPYVVIGGLLGAAFVAPWAAFPWLVLPALAMAWAGKGQSRKPEPRGAGVATALLAAVTSASLLAAASSSGLRISSEEFGTRDLRVDGLLADVPLHDAWAIDLKGHSSATLKDLGDAFRFGSPFQATPAVVGLGMLRGVAGLALGWDRREWATEESSLVHRLSEADHQRSATEPGTILGIWRVLYACPQQGVVETINGTAHVAVAATIGAGPEGPRLFLSFRVREVNWTTPFYMRLIDPARRFFVYPSLLRQFAHTWERGDWDSSEEVLTGEEK